MGRRRIDPDAASFLVAADSGLWVLGEGDLVDRLSPADARALAPSGHGDGATADLPGDAGDAVRVELSVPAVVRRLADGTLVARDRRAGDDRPISGDELGALADLAGLADLGAVRRSGEASIRAMALLVARGIVDLDATAEPSPGRHFLSRSAAGRAAPEAGRAAPPPDDDRVPVYPVCASPVAGVPLGLGDVVAAALAHEDGRLQERYSFRSIRNEIASVVEEVAADPRPVVLLLSNYLWSIEENCELVRQVRALAPGSVAIHGGPSTPKYEPDLRAFFAADHRPDVAVIAEGEATLPDLLDRLPTTLDVAPLVGTPGTVVRDADGTPVRGPDRPRIADLGTLPSPYLTGLFDHLDGGALGLMTVETNRGCPYGCTFCDWGSATASRIRKQPMERVLAELDWIADRLVGTLFIADANFGVMARDVEVARHIAELRRTRGAPRAILSSFAKNTVKHSAEIVRTWVEAGISTEGSVALQTTDPQTLENVRRSNIRIEKYDALAEEFRRLGLPVGTDLMLGLPGATVDTLKTDLQRCIDQEVTARIYPTVVLPNAPMNDPAYKAEFSLRLDDDGVVIGSSSFDDAAYAEMQRVRRAFRALEHFGVLRHVVRYVEHQTGMRAIDQVDAMSLAGRDRPEAWPLLRFVTHHLARWTVPPAPWPTVMEEVRRFVVDELGAPDEPGLDVVLAVQAALLPEPHRSYPHRVALDHDYISWYRRVLRPIGGAPTSPVPALTDLPAGELMVDDPTGVCGRNRRQHLREHPHPAVDSVLWNDFWIVDDWELGSELARPLLAATRDSAEDDGLR